MLQLDDLPEECLLMILDWLPPNHLLKMLAVNRQMNRLAADKMRTSVKTITSNRLIWRYDPCQHIARDRVLLMKPFNLVYDPLKEAALLSLLAKCPGVRCFDFGNYYLPKDMLMEVFRLCPDIECIKLTKTLISSSEWAKALKPNGKKIVHIVKRCDFTSWENRDLMPQRLLLEEAKTDSRLLVTFARSCPNVKRVDWAIGWQVTGGLANGFRMMPKSAMKKLHMKNRGYNKDWKDVKRLKMLNDGVTVNWYC